MTPFKGLVAFPITPMDIDGRVDVTALRALVRRLSEAGVDAIGLLGSTGSYPYLSRDERLRAIEAALAETGGATPVIAGIGALRTDETVRLARDAQAAGAAGGLLAPVSYTPLNDEEVFTHFAAVSGASSLPICIYNNPSTTRFTFSDELIGRLAALPHVGAVKNPAPAAGAAPAAIASLRARTPSGFSVGYSADWGATETLIAGADAWYSVVAGLFPELGLEITRAVGRGDADAAREADRRLAPLWALFKAFGGLRVIYAAAGLAGLCAAAPPLPILPVPDEARRRTEAVLRDLGLIA